MTMGNVDNTVGKIGVAAIPPLDVKSVIMILIYLRCKRQRDT